MMRTRILLFCILLLLRLPDSKPDLSADRAALLALRSAVGGRTLLWNVSNQNPCSWAGVRCQQNAVFGLRLPGVALSGEIPTGIFGNLTRLRTLSLRLNSLSGQLPSDLASCVGLRKVYLQGNRFSDEIPDFLFGLKGLVRLNLGGNNFSGGIAPGFNNLTRLKTLLLQSNQLSGSIPNLDSLHLDQFNASGNRLNGSVPKGLQKFGSTSFLGNLLCGKPLENASEATIPSSSANVTEPTSSTTSVADTKNHKLSGGAVAGIAIGSVAAFLILLVLLIILCRKRGSRNTRSFDIATIKQQELEIPREKQFGLGEEGGHGSGYSVAAGAGSAMVGSGGSTKKLVFFGNSVKAFDLEDLLRASAEVLGKGAFGTAYKAVLDTGAPVAVKRLRDVIVSEREFKERIEMVGAMNHQNLVPLRAYYYNRDEKLLVYDYMPMGSLSALIHGNKGGGRTPLNWKTRSGIALGAARGVQYLHSQGSTVCHGNIKASNVLLTKDHEARVSDFGLANLVGSSSSPTRFAGYQAPEVTEPRRVSQKADVYSFGIMLLELLTGKPPIHSLLNEEGVDLPRWVQSIVRDEWTSEVFDLELLRDQTVEDEMVQLLQLAIDCTAQYPDNRPSISEVTRCIEELRRSSVREDSAREADQASDGESSL